MDSIDREGWLDRLTRRFRKPDPERLAWEAPLRAELMWRLLALSVLAEILFLALWAAGVVRTAVFPWIGLESIGLLLLAVWLLRRRKVETAGPLLVVALSHVPGFLIPEYGVESAAPALLLPTIIIGGLAIGGYFLAGWTVVCTLILLWGSRFDGNFDLALLLFWIGSYAVTAYLAWLFSSHLENLLAASRRAEEDRREAVVQERTRLAREMHDTLAQGFTGIVVQINAAEQKTAAKEEPIWQHLEKARALARESLEEARRSILALRTSTPPTDLLHAIEERARRLLFDDSIEIETLREGTARELPEEARNELERVGQEAVANAIRHAGASRLRILLQYEARAVTLRVSDNGRGKSAGARGLGIQGMEERMRRLGGELAIDAAAGRGTTVIARLPLESVG